MTDCNIYFLSFPLNFSEYRYRVVEKISLSPEATVYPIWNNNPACYWTLIQTSSHSRSPRLIQWLEVIVFQVYDVSQSLICLSLIGDITNYKKFHECLRYEKFCFAINKAFLFFKILLIISATLSGNLEIYFFIKKIVTIKVTNF